MENSFILEYAVILKRKEDLLTTQKKENGKENRRKNMVGYR